MFYALTVAERLRLGPASPDVDTMFGDVPALEAVRNRRAGLLVDDLGMGLAPIIVERLLPVLRARGEERERSDDVAVTPGTRED